MTALTVTVDNNKNASLLAQMLKAISFVKKIEKEENEHELPKEEIRLLEARLEKYDKGKMKFSSWEDVKKRISSKK